ncbi:MAG TPA: hypothetical protein VIJ25_05055, partial [Methylococcales bacterium]
MKTKNILSVSVIFLFCVSVDASNSEKSNSWIVSKEAAPPVHVTLGTPLERPFELDFRYQPSGWQTLFCLPDDWQKSLVDKHGRLLYGYHGGYQSEFRTIVDINISGKKEQWISQALDDPKIPIVITKKNYDTIELSTTVCALGDGWVKPLQSQKMKTYPAWQSRLIEPVGRNDAQKILLNQAMPNQPADLCFTSTDNSWNGPLKYRFKAEPDKTYHVVFGFCEG